MTLDELISIAVHFESRFVSEKGYTTAHFRWAQVYKDSYSLVFNLYDEFQETLPADFKYKAEPFCSISVSLVDEHDSPYYQFAAWPSLEDRKRHVLLRQLSQLEDTAKQIETIQNATFLEPILAALTEARQYLEAPRPQAAPLDDEILF